MMENSLFEFIQHLPETHRCRLEYMRLKNKEAENEKLRGLLKDLLDWDETYDGLSESWHNEIQAMWETK